MADHSKPILTDNYTDVLAQIRGRFEDHARLFDPSVTSATSIPTNTIRWYSAGNTWQKWNGTAWSDLSSSYAINISGTAANATNATNINISATSSTDTSASVVLVANQATGNQAPFIDSGLLYNANTNNLTATTFTGALSGNATTASSLQTARTISLEGDVTGSVSFNGSADVSISATVADDSHNHVISNVDGLQSALDAKFGQGLDIPDGADLDTYTTTGWYHCNTNVFATNGINYPADFAGILKVYVDGSMVYQTYQCYQTVNGIFTRVKYNTTWEPWTRLATTSTNVATASTLETARTINGTSFNGSANITTANWGTGRTITIGSTGKTVNGSANVSWTLSEIGAASVAQTMHIGTTALAIDRASSAQTLTGVSIDGNADTSTRVSGVITGTSSLELVRGYMADSDHFRILIGGTSSDGGYVEIATADNGNEPIYVRQYTGTFTTPTRTLTLLDASGNTSIPGNITAAGNVTAYSDIKLKTDLLKIDNALDKVSQLTGYTYTRKDTGERQTGLIAQEVQKVLPEAVVPGEHLSLAYGNLVGLLVEAIKELKCEINKLKESQ